MELRQKIIYVVFALTVVYGIYYHFLSGEGIMKDQPASRPAEVPEAALTSEPLPAVSLQQVDRAGSNVPARELRWDKDPFRNNKTRKSVKMISVPESKIRAKPPKLSAISDSNGNKMAIVNGNIMQIGDKIGVWRLVELTASAALFDGPDGPVWIQLGG